MGIYIYFSPQLPSTDDVRKVELQVPLKIFTSDGKLIGTGPWILDEWIHDGHILFKSNKAYFDGIPLLESLKIRILPEILPRTAEFITGYLDIMEVPESEFLIWLNDKEWKNIHPEHLKLCLLYTSPSPRDGLLSRMPSSA